MNVSCLELCTQVKGTYAYICPVSLPHTEPLRQYRVGCVVGNVHKQVMPESCCHLTALHAHSHPCPLVFIPSPYSTFLIQRIFHIVQIYALQQAL